MDLDDRQPNGPEVTWHVPEGAVIRPGTGPSMLAGMVITSWCED